MISKIKFRFLIVVSFYFYSSLSIAQVANTGNYLYRCNEKLVEVAMEDLFNPPLASRVHVYPNIAAYEVLCKKNKALLTLSGQLNQLDSIAEPLNKVDYSLSALSAFTTVAKKLVYSEYLITDFEEVEFSKWHSANPNHTNLFTNSVEYGKSVATQIIEWMKRDNYNYTRTLTRYVLSDTIGAWRPTSPAYANALEPNWPLLRSFVFDSTNQIKAIPNVSYSENKHSVYYKNAMKLYEQSITLDTAKKLTAWYWDDNPNKLVSEGHINYFIHKVGPGGHWIRIAGQAVKNLGLDEYKAAEVYTVLTLAIYEGFLNCWTEKYYSNALRPETYINRLIAPKWQSYIETPPFPEYTSGHSVVSSVSATVLTAMIPQPYSFTDSSEMYINLPSRHFNSFREASNQASISRFYGGIHYMPALDNGILQGKEIGNFILKKFKIEVK